MADTSGYATLHFSTNDLPEKDRIAIWREYYGRSIFNVDVEPAAGTVFHSTMVTRALPDMQLMAGTMSAARISRDQKSIADGNDDLILAINNNGSVTVSANDRALDLGQGEGVLIDGSEITTFERHTAGGSCSLRISRSIVSASVADVDDVVMRKIPQRTDALKLLAGYLNTLLSETSMTSRTLRYLGANHIKDLVAISLGATTDAAELAHDRGIPAARLKEAKAYIIKNSRSLISIGTVAVHVGVTPRYLQRLFEIDGTTFSMFLLEHRLMRVHRMLSDPRYAGNTVEAIAYESGFSDISYFNRSFRRRYGLTPKEVRNRTDDVSAPFQPVKVKSNRKLSRGVS
jgi:AraC-like DNA-binding protein